MQANESLTLSFLGRNWQILLFIILVIAFPLAITTYAPIQVALIIGVYAINVTGLTLLTSYAGVVSLGHSAFFAFGAYISVILTLNFGINPWLSIAIACGITVAFAYAFATPFLRLRRAYLAMATLGLGEIVFLTAKDLTEITGGVNGITGIPFLRVGGIVLKQDWQFSYLIWGLVVLFIFLTENVGNSRLGRAFHAIRTNETAAQAIGINVRWELKRIFCFSALVSAFSGAILAHVITFIGPEYFTLNFSFSLLVLVIIGGANVWGGLVATIVLTGLSEVFRGAQDFSAGLYALILIGALFFFPEGLAALFPRENPRKQLAMTTRELSDIRTHKIPDRDKYDQGSKSTRNNMLELENVSMYFGGTAALTDVSASIGYNEIFGIIGPNGAGKTTLLNVINGFLSPQEGRIIFNHQDMCGKPPHLMARLGVGRTFQISYLFKGMTVVENVMVGCHIKGNSGIVLSGLNIGTTRTQERAMKDTAMKTLDFLGLENRASNAVESLSYGEQKLVELARALAMEPSLLLLDEPASGLNRMETRVLSDILLKIKDQGTTIILVEHNMPLIMSVSDSVLVLDFGRRIALGTPAEVSKDQKVITAYLGIEA